MEEIFLQHRDVDGRVTNSTIDRFPYCIGRDPENDLVLAHPSVSREHAFLRLSSGGVSVVDNKSRNGVFVNKEKVQQRLLKPGDLLHVGSVQLQFMALGGGDEISMLPKTEAEIEYFPSQKTWDPMESIAVPHPKGAEGASQRSSAFGWMVKLFLEAPLPEVYEHILDLVEETVPFDRCFLILYDESRPDDIEIVARRTHISQSAEVILSRDILRRVAGSREAVIVSTGDTSYSPTESFIRSGASTAICVPLIARDRVTGVIYVDRVLSDRSLSRADIDVIGPLAGFVALKIENVRLLQSHIDNQVLVRDLELAKTIQEGLLPQEAVQLDGYEIEGFTSSCYQVGGDYFDFLLRGDDRLTIVLGDVSGKGLSSALYMAGIRSALHAHIEDGLDIQELMARLEKHAFRTFRPDYFLTLVVGELDAQAGRFLYSNAGHLAPVIVTSDGELIELEATDPALNITECEQFHCHEYMLQPGDLLFLYTDGLVEAANPEDEFFGLDPLLEVLVEHRDEEVQNLRKRLLAAIETFTGDRSPNDDRTLILLRREWDDGEESTESPTEDLSDSFP